MTDIVLRQRHTLTMRKARGIAEDAAARLRRDFDLAYAWKGDTLQFRRTGVSGHVTVGATEIEIVVKLGLMLMPLKQRIEAEIAAQLSAHLSGDESPLS